MNSVQVDIRTLLITYSLVIFIIGVVIIKFGYDLKEVLKGVIKTGVALSIISFSLLFNALQDLLNKNLISFITLLFIVIGIILIKWGLFEFKKQPQKKVIDYSVIQAFFIALFYGVYIYPSLRIRIITLSLTVFYYSFIISLLFFRNHNKSNRANSIFIAALLLIIALVQLFRLLNALLIRGEPSPLYSDNTQVLIIFISLIYLVILSLSFIYLFNKELLGIKDRFLSVFAHEIKNPYNSILGFTRLMLDDEDDLNDHMRKRLKYVYTSAKNGFDLINNLLEWSKTQLGKTPFNPGKIAINEILTELMLYFKPLLSIKKINFQYNWQKDYKIFADRFMIELILRNLISNAIKYTPEEGSIELFIEERVADFLFSITDTGKGIDQSTINRIMQNESFISSQNNDEQEGTGIGLFISKTYIEMHDGNLMIENLPQKGCRFSFTISKTIKRKS